MPNLNVLVQRHEKHRKNNAYIVSIYDVITEIITEIIILPVIYYKKELKELLCKIFIY
jgi:hypothetical protein